MIAKPQLMAISETDSELSSIKMAAFLMQYHETMLQNIIENIRIMLQKH
mgnify:CR=1 FL=1